MRLRRIIALLKSLKLNIDTHETTCMLSRILGLLITRMSDKAQCLCCEYYEDDAGHPCNAEYQCRGCGAVVHPGWVCLRCYFCECVDDRAPLRWSEEEEGPNCLYCWMCHLLEEGGKDPRGAAWWDYFDVFVEKLCEPDPDAAHEAFLAEYYETH